MRSRRAWVRSVIGVACVLAIACTSGCTYLRNRGSDAKQMMDLGFTFSKKPQFGLYANCPMVTPVGYSKVDGYFVGMGGGKLGAGEHHQNNAGLLFWGREENSWKGFDKDDKATVESHKAGVVGIAQNAKDGSARYRPACVHYLHLGFVGVMWNLNYYKMADFFCGWFGYIPFGERSEVGGRVAQADSEPTRVAETNRKGYSPFELGPAADGPASAGAVALAATEPLPAPARKPVVAAAPAAPPKANPAAAPPAPVPAVAPAASTAPASGSDLDEIALAVARDVAAKKAEMAAATQAASDLRFSLEQLVP